MEKNVASQKWIVFAFEDTGGTNPGEPVTGDAANITAKISIDGAAGSSTDDTNPTEIEDGYYAFDLLQAETDGDLLLIMPESTGTTNVIGVPGVVYTTPENFNAIGIETDGHVHADVKEWATGAVTFSTHPDVNAAAIDDAQIKAATFDAAAIDAAAIATDAVSEIQSGLATAAALTTVDGIVDDLKLGIILGTVDTGLASASTTSCGTSLTGYTDDQLIGRVIIFTSGTCDGEATEITDYASTNGLITYTALTLTPGNGDTFKIV